MGLQIPAKRVPYKHIQLSLMFNTHNPKEFGTRFAWDDNRGGDSL